MLLVIFNKCHGGQSYLKSQKWLIWIEITNVWVGMDIIPCSDKFYSVGLVLLPRHQQEPSKHLQQ